MYRPDAVFYVVDADYDIVQVIQGYRNLVQMSYDYISCGIVGNDFKNPDENNQPLGIYCKTECIIVDECFKVVPTYVIKKDYIPPYPYRIHVKPGDWIFRQGPVPGIHKIRYTKIRRSSCNFPELRESCSYDTYESYEYSVSTRAKRINELKMAIYNRRSDVFNKYSWKKRKKSKQWM